MRSVAPRPASVWAPPARPRRSRVWPLRSWLGALRVQIRGDVLLALLLVTASLLGTVWAATSPGLGRVGITLGALSFVMQGATLLLSGWSLARGRALTGLGAGEHGEDGGRRVEQYGRWFAVWFSAQQVAWSAVGLALAAGLLLPRGATFDLTLATAGGLIAVSVCALAAALSTMQPLLTGQTAALAACWRSPIPHGVIRHGVRSWLARGVALLLLPTRLAQVRRWDAAQPQPFLRKIVQVSEDARRGRAGYLLDVRPAAGVSWRAELPQRAAVYLTIWLLGALVALIALRAGLIAPIVPALSALTGVDPLSQTPESQAPPTPEADGGGGGDGGGGSGGGNQGGGQGSGSASGAGASGQGDGGGQGDGSASGQGSAGDGPGSGQPGEGAGGSGGSGGSSGQSQGAGEPSGQQGQQGQQAGQQGQSGGQGQGAGQQQGDGQQGQGQQGQGQGSQGQGQRGAQEQSSGEQGQRGGGQDQQGAGASGGEQETGEQQGQGQGSQGQSQGDQSQAQGGGAQQPEQGEGSGGGGDRQGPQANGDDTQQGESQGGSERPGDGAGGPGSTRSGDPSAPPTPPALGASTPVQPPSAQSTDDIVSIELPAIGPGQQAQGTPQPFPGTPVPAQPGQAGPQGPNASGAVPQGSRSAGQPLPPWIQSLLDGAGAP